MKSQKKSGQLDNWSRSNSPSQEKVALRFTSKWGKIPPEIDWGHCPALRCPFQIIVDKIDKNLYEVKCQLRTLCALLGLIGLREISFVVGLGVYLCLLEILFPMVSNFSVVYGVCKFFIHPKSVSKPKVFVNHLCYLNVLGPFMFVNYVSISWVNMFFCTAHFSHTQKNKLFLQMHRVRTDGIL